MLTNNLKPRGYTGLKYPVGLDMTAVMKYAKAAAPHLDTLAMKRKSVLVCRGSSGAILASALQMFMKQRLPVVHIKKSGENSHACGSDQSTNDKAIIFVDDFMCSGGTVLATFQRIKELDLIGGSVMAYAIVLSQRTLSQANELLASMTATVTFDHFINIQTP